MPNLSFLVDGVEPVTRGMTPLLQFDLHISDTPGDAVIHGLLLSAQIQFQCPLRHYSPEEKAKLVDLFGAPDRWGETLRNRLWTYSQTTVGPFTGSVRSVLPVPCSYDLNLAATKYLYGLEAGEVSLLFLFSGSVFYPGPNGQLQAERISWNKECTYRFPIGVWQDLMEQHYPNSGWVCVRRDVFDRLYEFRRRHGLPGWEQTLELMLNRAEADPGGLANGEQCRSAREAVG